MADQVVRFGADDREVGRAYDRLDSRSRRSADAMARNNSRATASIARLGKAFLGIGFARGLFRGASDAVLEYAKVNDQAAMAVERFRASNDVLVLGLGRDLSTALQQATPFLEDFFKTLERIRSEAVNIIADPLGGGAEGRAQDAAKRIEEEQTRAAKAGERMMDLRRRFGAAAARARGDNEAARLLEEDELHQQNAKSIAEEARQYKLTADQVQELNTIEDRRHADELQRIRKEESEKKTRGDKKSIRVIDPGMLAPTKSGFDLTLPKTPPTSSDRELKHIGEEASKQTSILQRIERKDGRSRYS